MPAHAGKFPGTSYSPVEDKYKSGRLRSSIVTGNEEWDLSTGWHPVRQKGWKSKVSKKMKGKGTFQGWDGQDYDIYVYAGFDDFFGYHAKGEDHPDYDGMMAFAEHAFDQERPDHEEVVTEKGCGHISELSYATKSQVLKVTFWNGSRCLYFRVPTIVAGQLLYLARTGETMQNIKGEQRHALGIYFWDLVRIRGQQHGSKYQFEYESRARGKLSRGGSRHKVELTREMAEVILASNKAKFNQLFSNISSSTGTKLLVDLDEEEFAKYAEELEKQREGASGGGYYQVTDYERDPETGKIKYESIAGQLVPSSGQSDVDRYTQNNLDVIEAEFARARKTKVYERAYNNARAEGKSELRADIEALKQCASDDVMIISKDVLSTLNLKNGQLKGTVSERDRQRAARAANGAGAIRSWYKENYPARYAASRIGRTWTIEQLEDFANPSIPNNINLAHAKAYKRLVQDKNWDGALDFLKNHKVKRVYKDPATGKVTDYGMAAYASPFDEIEY